MAKKNSKTARKCLNPVDNPSTISKKRLKQVEETSTAKKRLQLLEDDSSTKKSSPQPLENAPVEYSGDDERMATGEDEEEHESDSLSQTAPVKTPCVSASAAIARSSDADSGPESKNVLESEPKKEKEEVFGTGDGEAQPTNKTELESEVVAITEIKKEYFQRKWSEDDEVVLLQEMVDFNNNEGKTEDMPVFFNIVKDKFSFVIENMRQLTSKIRRLKEKYTRKRSFSNDHDRKCFKLANVIWRSIMVDEDAVKRGDEKLPRDWFENSFLVGALTSFGLDEDVVKVGWNMVPIETKKKMEEKFSLLRAKEFQYLLLKTTVLQETVAMLAGAN